MRKLYSIPFILIVTLLLSSCSANRDSGTNKTVDEETTDIVAAIGEPVLVAEGLDVPWSIERVGESFYVTERPGSIVKIEKGKIERQAVELEKQLYTASEAGLLGFVLAPDFTQSQLAYAYYSYEDNSVQFNRIVTLHLENGIWSEETLLVDRIPSAAWHSGGRLKIGPDGMLYTTTGDASTPDIAQNIESLSGKILRMNLDGTIPDDNPYANSYVYSYGHRNPQGMTWLPDGTFYASEHGQSANDEINLIEAGENYGWPIIQGVEEAEGLRAPLFTSGRESTWAPSGMDHYNERLYVAALRGTTILAFNLNTGDYEAAIEGFGRIRDVRIEGNELFFVTNNLDGRGTPQENDDKLYRVTLES